MKRYAALLAAAAVLFSCTGCGDKPIITVQTEQIEISLSWWGNDARNEYTLEAVKKFEALHPEIKVNCNYSEWSGYQARSNVQMASDTEADVMQINYAWIEQYSPDGDGYYDISLLTDIIDLSNFSEEALSYGMQNGKLNAIPIALNTMTVYINKTVYESYGLAVPSTWEDIFEAAETMNGEVYPISMTSKSAWFYIVAYAEQQTGKQFMTVDGELNFQAEDIAVMLDFYSRLINERAMPQVEYYDKLNLESGIYAGTLAWLSDGASYCDNAISNGYEFVVADYPAGESSASGEGWYAKPATMYAISKSTSYPEEAAMLLDFLLNSEEMAELQGVEKGIPISNTARSYLADHDMLTGIQYSAFLEMEENTDKLSLISPYFEEEDLIDAFQDGCNAVLYGKADSLEKAQELYQTFEEILTERQN
jgi:oligogalacturonide transport system substrate-binding protein